MLQYQVRGNEGCTAYSAIAPAWLDQWPVITHKQVRHQSMVCYFLYKLHRETFLGQGKITVEATAAPARSAYHAKTPYE